MSEETETSLSSEFNECQCIVENILQDKYGTGKNDKLRGCVDKLQQITKTIDNLSLFSTNDDVEELPTSSINYLLVPAYLGYALEEFNAGMEKRATYLSAAKIHYRQFLENLLIYRLIAFKLPWLHKKSEDDENDDKGDNVGRQKANLEKGSQRRQEKITRLNQRKKLEDALAQLKLKRNDDDFTERQAILTLIRLWSIRALESLSAIEDELKILDFAEKNKGKVLPDKGQSSKSVMAKPFIIAKTVAQKAVFGLGYPSIPTYTVDEWYDQMMAKKSFSEFPTTTTITGHENDGAESDGVDEDDLDESTREKKRQKAIQSDEWKDSHRRGWGNMHNKGKIKGIEPMSSENSKKRKSAGSAGLLWADLTLMQDLEEKLNTSGSIMDSRKKFERGSESYALPDGANFPDVEEKERNSKLEACAEAKEHEFFGDEPGDELANVESFGVQSLLRNTRKRRRERSPAAAKRHFERKFKYTNAQRPGSSNQMSTATSTTSLAETTSSKHSHSAKGSDGYSKGKVARMKGLLAKNYSTEKLFNADFPPDSSIAEVGRLMAEALGERAPNVIQEAVESIGKEKSFEIFNETKAAEKAGGMLTQDGRRRRTPGGIFLYLVKQLQGSSVPSTDPTTSDTDMAANSLKTDIVSDANAASGNE